MTYTVYIDVVFFVNAVMDFVVLAILNRILDSGAGWGRLLSGAAVGGLWACLVSVLPGMPVWLRGMGTYLGVSSLMVFLAFRPAELKALARAGLGMYLVTAVLSGVMLALYRHTRAGYYLELLVRGERVMGLPALAWFLVAAGGAAGAYGLVGLGKNLLQGRIKGRRYCRVRLGFKGSEAGLTALIDTGNCLKEPVSGRPVHVVTASAIAGLCPRVDGVIYVPYQAVGTSHGLLPAIFLDWMEVELDYKRYRFERPLVAVIRESLSPSGKYQMLLQEEQWGKDEASYDECSQHTGGKFHDYKSIHSKPLSTENRPQL